MPCMGSHKFLIALIVLPYNDDGFQGPTRFGDGVHYHSIGVQNRPCPNLNPPRCPSIDN
jgi:hypothetical protein